VETLARTSFNACLANLYADGSQGMGWHQDNEKELDDSAIASVSLGAERRFDFRHIHSRQKVSVFLEQGSLLLMKGSTQKYWQHQLPKSAKVTTPRINLTFRRVIAP
jgi:alkylated DNA repair dioxygenase AlkB